MALGTAYSRDSRTDFQNIVLDNSKASLDAGRVDSTCCKVAVPRIGG